MGGLVLGWVLLFTTVFYVSYNYIESHNLVEDRSSVSLLSFITSVPLIVLYYMISTTHKEFTTTDKDELRAAQFLIDKYDKKQLDPLSEELEQLLSDHRKRIKYNQI